MLNFKIGGGRTGDQPPKPIKSPKKSTTKKKK